MAADELPYIDSEALIEKVERRPPLYDHTSPTYNDRVLKSNCWEEVASELVENWAEMTTTERVNRLRDIQTRWRSVRDAFIKTYRGRGHTLKTNRKRRPYIYYDKLKFLLPIINQAPIKVTKLNTTNDSHENESKKLPDTSTTNILDYESSQSGEEPAIVKFEENDSYVSDLGWKSPEPESSDRINQINRSQIHSDPIGVEEDDDKLFLHSLLSSFKKMDEDTKFEARIEILKIVRKSLQKSNDS